jgi:hypothetical protein
MQNTREDHAATSNQTRIGKILRPWIALICLLAWIFCLLVLPPLFVGVLSVADLCRGKKPRLFARGSEDIDCIADYE